MFLRFMQVLSLATVVLLSSCASPSPQSRIANDPQSYEALNQRDQQLVSQGEIRKGMSPKAVALAWGAPQATRSGQRGSTNYLRWDYLRYQPNYVHTNSFYYGRSRYRHPYYGWNAMPEIEYHRERYATVEFVQGRVHSWERLR